VIKGEYIFYQDGKEIYRSQNLITKFGKRFLTTYLAGNVSFANKDLAIGIADGTDFAAADTNTRLGFEFYRLPVSFGSVDIQTSGGNTTYAVVYKSTVPQDVAGIIKEIGLYPGTRTSINNYDSRFLSDFENNREWYDSSNANPLTVTSPTPRIGDTMVEHKFNTGDTSSTTKEFKYDIGQFDMSGYSVNDNLTLAYNRANTNSSQIRIKFYSSASDYFYGDIVPSGTGNKVSTISMSDVFGNQSGTPDSASISTIGIEVTRASAASAATIYLDGLRINDQDTFDPTFGLISRSVLGSSITKVAGRPIDIEYKITLGF
jgi:hypothetical protein